MPALSEERLAKLAEARKKALDKRRMLGDLARKEKAVREKMLQDRLAAADAALKGNDDTKMSEAAAPSMKEKKEKKEKTKTRTKKTKKIVVPQLLPSSEEDDDEGSSSDDEASSEDDEEQKSTVKRKKTMTVKYRPSDNNTNFKRSRTNNELSAVIAREELQRRVQQENYELAFQSVFPGYRLM